MADPLKWTTFEAITSDTGERPVSSAIASKGIDGAEKATATIWRLQQMIQDMGWQKARITYKYNYKKGSEPRVVHKTGALWLLKCKPSCWRLYFYVDEVQGQIVYLRAVCKKKDKEDEQDIIKAEYVVNAITKGDYSISAFPFPLG